MKTHTIVIEFAKQYGIKEGLVLTELCRRAFNSGTNAIPFPVSQGLAFFPYLSTKQIRLSLQKLKLKGVIVPILPETQTFDRSCHYQIEETTYRKFQQIMIARQLFLNDSFDATMGVQ